MDLFTKLFGEFLVFVYHCFDRIVIHGYLTALSRPELVVRFFRDIVGVAEVSKEALSQRTADYQNWVEAYARNHSIPIEWAEKGVRKENHVLPWLRRMARRDAYGVYFIFKSMEQGPTYRISLPKYPAKDPHYRIVARQRSRFTHYYFYIRDEALGPMALRVASFLPFQTTSYLNGHNFIEQELKRAGIGFRKHDNAFLAVDDVAALQAAADRLSPEIIHRRLDSGLCSSLNFEGRGGFPRAKMSESISDNPNRRLSDGVVAVGGFALDPGPSPRRRQALRSGHRAAVHDPRHGRGSQFLPANA